MRAKKEDWRAPTWEREMEEKKKARTKIRQTWDFPGGAVVKNPPANAGDMGSSPGPGRPHMPWSNKAHVPQLLSPRAATTEARAPRARAPQQEKPPQWEAHALQQRVAPARRN